MCVCVHVCVRVCDKSKTDREAKKDSDEIFALAADSLPTCNIFWSHPVCFTTDEQSRVHVGASGAVNGKLEYVLNINYPCSDTHICVCFWDRGTAWAPAGYLVYRWLRLRPHGDEFRWLGMTLWPHDLNPGSTLLIWASQSRVTRACTNKRRLISGLLRVRSGGHSVYLQAVLLIIILRMLISAYSANQLKYQSAAAGSGRSFLRSCLLQAERRETPWQKMGMKVWTNINTINNTVW